MVYKYFFYSIILKISVEFLLGVFLVCCRRWIFGGWKNEREEIGLIKGFGGRKRRISVNDRRKGGWWEEIGIVRGVGVKGEELKD